MVCRSLRWGASREVRARPGSRRVRAVLRVQTTNDKVERTRQMVAVAEELLALCSESRRVATELLTNAGPSLTGEGVHGTGLDLSRAGRVHAIAR
jgi:methyl coenzyme M reductase gamma subunit